MKTADLIVIAIIIMCSPVVIMLIKAAAEDLRDYLNK